jgi:hypothetical protein
LAGTPDVEVWLRGFGFDDFAPVFFAAFFVAFLAVFFAVLGLRDRPIFFFTDLRVFFATI